MPFTLQPASPADLPEVVKLMNTAYRGFGAQAGWTTETAYIEGDRTSESLLQEEISAKPDAALLIAKDCSTSDLQACVWLEQLAPETWYLGSLSVHPALQNSGLGRQLLTAAEQWAFAKGARTLRITVVNVRTALIAWYERRAYRRTGDTHLFPYNDRRFGTPLRNDLSFTVLEKQLTTPQASSPKH